MKTQTLTEVCERYILSTQLCQKHQQNTRNKIKRFAEFLGGPVVLSALTADDFNRYLIHLEGLDKSPHTVRGYRTCILTLLRWARWKPEEREYIRRIRVPTRVVEGWTLDEVRRLTDIAKTLRGFYENGVKRSVFWLAAIHAGYSTALRWGDLAVLPVTTIAKDRVCTLTMNKTRLRVTVRFSETAMALIAEHGQDVVLPCVYTQKWFCCKFSSLVERAEIRGGSFKWLRRTAGSYADRERRGDGRRLLGHQSDQVFDMHYRIEEICNNGPVEPVAL